MNPKFRIWDKANKCWATDFTISLDGDLLCDNGTTLFIKDNFVLTQWTYNFDKNKKEIYVSDIVKLDGHDIFYVSMFRGTHCLSWIQGNFIHNDRLLADFKASEIEVIGDTYENGDLLDSEV